jgi:N6-L-threonylcarbamoyladenine synthase
LLSNVISSQVDIHALTGGVVPEVASRHHLEQVNAVVAEALSQAGVGFGDIDAVAVANRPGLLGALLVGVSAAKAIAFGLDIPLIGVHHIEAHIYANFLTNPNAPLPAICLVASGGHTEIFLIRDHGQYEVLGRTRDDAAGEAFDKCARVIGLGYPGGIEIDRRAKHGDSTAISLPRAYLTRDSLDFSFSGLKTAVLNLAKSELGNHPIEDWCASIQEAIVDVLVKKTIMAAHTHEIRSVMAAGGVAANSSLQARLREACEANGMSLVIPAPLFCTDNAAMVACAGAYRFANNLIDDLSLDTFPSEPLALASR